MRGVPEGVQAQAPPDGAQAATHGREALPVLQVPEEVLPLRLLQPAHEPPLRHLQALPRLRPLSGAAAYLNVYLGSVLDGHSTA